MRILGISLKKISFLVVIISFFILLAINPNLRAYMVANFGFASAIFVSVVIPAYMSYLWNYFSEGRPFLFFLFYFSSLTGFLLIIPDKELYNLFFYFLSAKWSLIYQSHYLFSIMAIFGLLFLFHFGANMALSKEKNYSLLRFFLLTILYLVYIFIVLKSLTRVFGHT